MTIYVLTRRDTPGDPLTMGHASEKEAESHRERMDDPEDWTVVEWVALPADHHETPHKHHGKITGTANLETWDEQ